MREPTGPSPLDWTPGTDGVGLVTGASGGIGQAIAERLAAKGMPVAVASREEDDRYPGSVWDVVRGIRSGGGIAQGYDCDLSIGDQRDALVPEVEAALGPVEVLVNCAAVTTMQPIADFPERRARLMLEVQVIAPLILAQQVLPGMRRRGRGSIINISSSAARLPEMPPRQSGTEIGRRTMYGACKAALERMTTGMAAEVYDDKILVVSLAPTYVVPTFGAKSFFDVSDFAQTEPPSAIADAVAFLSDARARHSSLTGQSLDSQGVLEDAGWPVPRLCNSNAEGTTVEEG